MEVVCLNLLITSFSLRSCHANIMPSTNGCTSLRSDSSIPCRRSWSDKYSILIWSALIECSMAKGTCLLIPSVSVFIADFSWGAVFYLFPFHSQCCCGLVLCFLSSFVCFMVLFWFRRCKYAAKVQIILDTTKRKQYFLHKKLKNASYRYYNVTLLQCYNVTRNNKPIFYLVQTLCNVWIII